MRMEAKSTFIGINIISNAPQFCMAAIDDNAKLIALSSGNLGDTLAYISGVKNAIVGINSPSNTNYGYVKKSKVIEDIKETNMKLSTYNMRICEYELFVKGYTPGFTPSSIKKCPKWVRNGFRLYKRCQELGYSISQIEINKKSLVEVNTETSFKKFANYQLLDKITFEGRLQRQLILYEMGMDIPDPMCYFEELTRYRLLNGNLPLEDIYQIEELNAICAAFSVYLLLQRNSLAEWIGEPDEGQIMVPPGKIKW